MTSLFIEEAPLLPAKLEECCTGFLAMPRSPRAVELGFMLRGSDTDRSDGTLFEGSSGMSLAGDSRGVLGSEESPEPGGTGKE